MIKRLIGQAGMSLAAVAKKLGLWQGFGASQSLEELEEQLKKRKRPDLAAAKYSRVPSSN